MKVSNGLTIGMKKAFELLIHSKINLQVYNTFRTLNYNIRYQCYAFEKHVDRLNLEICTA
jgi:hypothetical protein